MARSTKDAREASDDPFRRLSPEQLAKVRKGCAHVFGKGYRCTTDTLGYPCPDNRGPAELVLDSSVK
jgi:hypothetical protein